MGTNVDECCEAEAVGSMKHIVVGQVTRQGLTGESSEEITFEVNNLRSVGIN